MEEPKFQADMYHIDGLPIMEHLTESAKRTEPDYRLATQRLSDPHICRLLHAAIGMATEAGEFLDMVKRHIYYGKEIDRTNGLEEIGDQTWYQRIALDEWETGMLEVMVANVRKLKARFPDKFTEQGALVRDLDKERKVLEDSTTRPNKDVPVVPREGDRYKVHDQVVTILRVDADSIHYKGEYGEYYMPLTRWATAVKRVDVFPLPADGRL